MGAMGVMGWVRVRAAKGIMNFELGTSYKLAPAGGKKGYEKARKNDPDNKSCKNK